MLTAMLAVKNILGANYNLWQVNTDQEYQEEIRGSDGKALDEFALLASTQPQIPERSMARIERPAYDEVIIRAFARIDKLALAIALGSVWGLAIFIATLLLIIEGGKVADRNLQLLSQYFIGYTITVKGAFIGMGYSFFWGFIWGWLFAYLRNLSLGYLINRAKSKAESSSFRNLMDYI